MLDCLRYLHAMSDGLIYGLVGRPGMAQDRVQARTVHDDNPVLHMFIFAADEVVRETCCVILLTRFYISDLRELYATSTLMKTNSGLLAVDASISAF